MEYKVKKAKNPVVKSFWQNEYAKTGKREREEMIHFSYLNLDLYYKYHYENT